jgi:hypothetical protein
MSDFWSPFGSKSEKEKKLERKVREMWDDVVPEQRRARQFEEEREASRREVEAARRKAQYASTHAARRAAAAASAPPLSPEEADRKAWEEIIRKENEEADARRAAMSPGEREAADIAQARSTRGGGFERWRQAFLARSRHADAQAGIPSPYAPGRAEQERYQAAQQQAEQQLRQQQSGWEQQQRQHWGQRQQESAQQQKAWEQQQQRAQYDFLRRTVPQLAASFSPQTGVSFPQIIQLLSQQPQESGRIQYIPIHKRKDEMEEILRQFHPKKYGFDEYYEDEEQE